MKKISLYVLSLLLCANINAQYIFVFTGESNAGGYANNNEVSSGLLGSRPSVRILNNTTKTSFDTLHISTIGDGLDNTHVLHAATSGWGARHGWELEIANLASNGTLANPTYIVKTGQGGTTIANWAVGATYNGGDITVNPWQLMMDRVDSAINILTRQNGVAPTLVILYSQGINNAIAGTDTTTWKTATIAHHAKMRARWGSSVPILMTDFASITATNMTNYNTAIRQVASSNANNYLISTAGAGLDTDANHWNASGMALIGDRMITQFKLLFPTTTITRRGIKAILQ